MKGRVHIIGAGLAGLSAALRLIQAGQKVSLYEAMRHAGGRCRTFHDPRLGRDVDNGNHLVLSGNRSTLDYLALAGATDRIRTLEAAFPFVDLGTSERWQVKLGQGVIPWWIFSARHRVPGTGVLEYLRAARLARAGEGESVAEVIRDRGPLWTRFWVPLTLAALNTTPDRAAAPLLWAVIAETFGKGASACRPILAPKGLGTALVDPAVAHLEQKGAEIAFEHALREVTTTDDRLTSLQFANGRSIELGPDDRAILALPPTRLKSVLPWMEVPRDDASILNAHFLVDDPALAKAPPITGMVNSTTHWLFVRGDVVSLTVSAADRLGLMSLAPDELIPMLWQEVVQTLGLTRPHLAARINKERRATFDQSIEGIKKRPQARTPLANLILAGDATATGLPATIEGAIRSGETAARLAA